MKIMSNRKSLGLASILLVGLATSVSANTYSNTAIVAATGGDYTTPQDAVANVATWCGTPSATNLCLIKLMPGLYDLGNGTLIIPSNVGIAGSGQDNTKILSAPTYNAALRMGYDTRVSDLTVEVNGDIGIMHNGTSGSVRNVTVIGHANTRDATGIHNQFGTVDYENITVIMDGTRNKRGMSLTSNGYKFVRGAKVTISNTGGSSGYGIYMNNYTNLQDAWVEARGDSGSSNIAVHAWGGSINHTHAIASGGNFSVGFQFRGTTQVHNSIANVYSATTSTAARNSHNTSASIFNSTLQAATSADATTGSINLFNTVVTNSTTGNVSCTAVSTTSGAFHSNSCP